MKTAIGFPSPLPLSGPSFSPFPKKIAKSVNIEAFIGVLYILSFAASILILDKSPHGEEEFKAILSGNILWLNQKDVLSAFIIYGILGGIHFVFRKNFMALSFDGSGSLLWEFLFFLSFAFVLVKSVQMAGILQVFSFLIVPALIGRLYTRKPARVLLIGWIVGLLASIVGIGISYKFDLPTAPMTVASLSLIFMGLLLVKTLRMRNGGSNE